MEDETNAQRFPETATGECLDKLAGQAALRPLRVWPLPTTQASCCRPPAAQLLTFDLLATFTSDPTPATNPILNHHHHFRHAVAAMVTLGSDPERDQFAR